MPIANEMSRDEQVVPADSPNRLVADWTNAIERDFSALVKISGEILDQVGRRDHSALGNCSQQLTTLRKNLASSYLGRGTALADSGQNVQAAIDFGRTIELDSNHAGAYLARARVLRSNGDFATALEDLNEFLRLEPASVLGLADRGQLHRERGDLTRAIADFTTALRYAPNSPRLHLERGLALCLNGEKDRAAEDLLETLRQFPESLSSCRVETGQTPAKTSPVQTTAFTRAEAHRERTDVTVKSVPLPAAIPPQSFVRKSETAPTGPEMPSKPRPLHPACPDCGRPGQISWFSSEKLFRCSGCQNYYKTDGTSRLIRAIVPASKTAPKSSPRPKPARRKRDWSLGRLRVPLFAIGPVLIIVVLVMVLRSTTSNPLESRGAVLARAWLSQDLTHMQAMCEQTPGQKVEAWLARNPPPAFARPDKAAKPDIDVSVTRNNGASADLAVRIGVKNPAGLPTVFVVYQHWVKSGGSWYFVPDGDDGKTGKNGPARGSKRV